MLLLLLTVSFISGEHDTILNLCQLSGLSGYLSVNCWTKEVNDEEITG